MHDLKGQDVLDIIATVEGRTGDVNGQLTILTSAISIIAMKRGISRDDLLSGIRQAFNNARRHTVPVQ